MTEKERRIQMEKIRLMRTMVTQLEEMNAKLSRIEKEIRRILLELKSTEAG
jgi:hypothetical protein